MKRVRLYVISILLLACAGYLAYQLYLPVMVAKSFSSRTSPLLPKELQVKIEKVRKPVNEGAELIVKSVHQSEDVTMDDLLNAIDNVTEEQALAFLDELTKTQITSTDQVFSMTKKHFPVDFNVEIFRKPFSEKASVPLIRKCIKYANIYKRREEMDAETAKSIAKRILLQKEEEFNKLLTKTN
jgi:hypothetical protein